MMGKMAWLKVIAQNRRTIFKLVREGFKAGAWRGAPARIPLAQCRRRRRSARWHKQRAATGGRLRFPPIESRDGAHPINPIKKCNSGVRVRMTVHDRAHDEISARRRGCALRVVTRITEACDFDHRPSKKS